MAVMAENALPESVTRRVLGKRTRDIELPASGPPDPRLPNYGQAGQRIREGLDILKKKKLLTPPQRITGARG